MENYRADLVRAGLPFITKAKLIHDFDPKLVQQIPQARRFKDLGDIAVAMIEKRGKEFAYVSGRLRTGGKFVRNAINMDSECDWLAAGVHPYRTAVFYQLVFQTQIHTISEELYWNDSHGFIHDLCDNFCQPVLHHELLNSFITMSEAHMSDGSNREFKILTTRKDITRILIRSIEEMKASALQALT